MDRSISPPPLKRQRRDQEPSAASGRKIVAPSFTRILPPVSDTLRVFSWNINGIEPFVQAYFQESITSFFKPIPASSSSATGRKRAGGKVGDFASDSEDEEDAGEDDAAQALSTGGKPSLRLALKRFGWPHILFLQEVKIKPGDSKMMGAVGLAVNDSLEVKDEGQLGDHEPSLCDTSRDGESRYLKDGGPEYVVHFNLPADPYNAKGFGGKVYGVATIIRKDFASNYVQDVRGVSWDREGRIQIIETREVALPLELDTILVSNDTSSFASAIQRDADVETESAERMVKFAVINIYAVNGTTSPYYSTDTGVEAGTRHDRKLAVHADLLRETSSLLSEGFHIIIAGDLNIARSELDGYPNLRAWPHQHVINRADFNNKFFTSKCVDVTPSKASYSRTKSELNQTGAMKGFDGVDTFRHVHGNERRYSYYPTGRTWGSSCDRVDLIIVSKSLSGHVKGAGICDNPIDRGPSDHCPIWAEIGCPDGKCSSSGV